MRKKYFEGKWGMNAKVLLSLLVAILLLLCNAAWAQASRTLQINPSLPNSDDLVTISVSNSKCYLYPQTVSDLENHRFQITLRFSAQYAEQCLKDDADAPDFEMSVGPLEPGEYQVVLYVGGGGFALALTDTKRFAVAGSLPPVGLSAGGITGLYYQPEADGHYIYILETDFTTLVVWTTFDAEGNPYWVYGTGQLQNGGSTVIAEAYINRSTGFAPGIPMEVIAEHWGQLRVDFSSCTDGTVTYQSDLPEVGYGQFPVRRLAYSKQIGCVNTE